MKLYFFPRVYWYESERSEGISPYYEIKIWEIIIMGFTSEGNIRLTEDANCRNKEIQHHAEIFRVLS